MLAYIMVFSAIFDCEKLLYHKGNKGFHCNSGFFEITRVSVGCEVQRRMNKNLYDASCQLLRHEADGRKREDH
jgi:hypothetical protein